MTGGMLLDLIASGEAAAARQWLEAAPRKLDGSASAQLAITMLGFSNRAKRLPAPGVAGKARRFQSATDQSILIEAMAAAVEDRSEERRVGHEGVRTCRSRWSQYQQKKHEVTPKTQQVRSRM